MMTRTKRNGPQRGAKGALQQTNSNNPLLTIEGGFEAAQSLLQQSQEALSGAILTAAQQIAACFAAGGKLLVCGNGGSAADAQHLAAELVGRFKLPDRPALPAMALTADTAVLTAWANDVGYEDVFARQVEAFGQPKDLLIAISTSGRSANLIEALKVAHRKGLSSIALLGRDGGTVGRLADISLIVPSADGQRIQELHILIIHLLCQLVELELHGEMVDGISGERNGTRPLEFTWSAEPGS